MVMFWRIVCQFYKDVCDIKYIINEDQNILSKIKLWIKRFNLYISYLLQFLREFKKRKIEDNAIRYTGANVIL